MRLWKPATQATTFGSSVQAASHDRENGEWGECRHFVHDGLLWVFALLVLGMQQIAVAVEHPVLFDPAKLEFFEKKIRPLLIENCINCHSAENGGRGELRVDDRNGLMDGGGRGPAVIPGKPDQSLLIKAVRHQGGLEMPPKKQLTDEQIADLETWILEGVAWPPVEVSAELIQPKPEYDQLRKEHWAWQPLNPQGPPQVADPAFVWNEIDRFILAKWNEKGLVPVRDADKPAWIRRVSFDLTGLPPTVAESAEFLGDAAPDAFEKVVDRLLKSPAYGERWGRHWLDVARYGESTGSARNLPMPHAWRYRDYVIDAFSNDKPYDQFLREQVAGDLLPANSPAEKAEQLIATGFLALGVKDVNQRFKVRFMMDNIDEQIDTVTRAILGLTASCARCHDHKFDPIPTVDYYALAGIFQSSDLCAGLRSKMGGGGLDYYDTTMLLDVSLETKSKIEVTQKIQEQEQVVAAARTAFQALKGTPEGMVKDENGKTHEQIARQKLTKAEQDLGGLKDPAAYGSVTYGLRESKKIADTTIRIRGEAEKQGPTVPRGFLSVIEYPGQPKVNPSQSGRLELAQWLTSDQNPLTQRVIVNRIWQHLFQQGLVTSVDNFGVSGDRPSHPELLDYLAREFVQGGWSVKKLVRTIVLSHTYRLSADGSAANLAVDPANRLVWRHTPRRLDAEEIRDAMLATAGKLKRTRPEASPASRFKVIEIGNTSPEAKRLHEAALASEHRSLFLPLVRGITPRALEVFDFAEQGMVTGSRDSTTVPTQALYLLNDPFVRMQGRNFASRLLSNAEQSDPDRVQQAYQFAFNRPATEIEVGRVLSYLEEFTEMIRETQEPVSAPALVTTEGPAVPAVVVNGEDPQPAGSATPPPKKSSPRTVLPAGEKAEGGDAANPNQQGISSDPRRAAWTSFCQALLGTAEFRYLQ